MFVNRIATYCALVALLQFVDAPGAVTIAGGLGKEGQARVSQWRGWDLQGWVSMRIYDPMKKGG